MDLLTQSGKGHWLKQRSDTVYAKGKGELQTFWLVMKNDPEANSNSEETTSSGALEADNSSSKILLAELRLSTKKEPSPDLHISAPFAQDDKNARLTKWNTEILKKVLLEIVAHRKALGTVPDDESTMRSMEHRFLHQGNGKIALDELDDSIALPGNNKRDVEWGRHYSAILATTKLDEKVLTQLHEFVMNIARLYNQNPFHSFEHASHVTMSVCKLLSRINSAERSIDNKDHAYGITSDPITQFSIVLSALIHDVGKSSRFFLVVLL